MVTNWTGDIEPLRGSGAVSLVLGAFSVHSQVAGLSLLILCASVPCLQEGGHPQSPQRPFWMAQRARAAQDSAGPLTAALLSTRGAGVSGCNYCFAPEPARTQLPAPPHPGTHDTIQVPRVPLQHTHSRSQPGSPGVKQAMGLCLLRSWRETPGPSLWLC